MKSLLICSLFTLTIFDIQQLHGSAENKRDRDGNIMPKNNSRYYAKNTSPKPRLHNPDGSKKIYTMPTEIQKEEIIKSDMPMIEDVFQQTFQEMRNCHGNAKLLTIKITTNFLSLAYYQAIITYTYAIKNAPEICREKIQFDIVNNQILEK